ncbi:hypothetical protein [Streptomyces sp. NPDC002889]|uniref:hypothetical protein n=1 Tax=Streptomyces sp. NPDC002889 TaxID=3364669 RepID=UPI003677B5EC
MAAAAGTARGRLRVVGGAPYVLTADKADNTALLAETADVQGYGFHGAGSDNSSEPGRTGHQANLCPQLPYGGDFRVDGAVRKYLDSGLQ